MIQTANGHVLPIITGQSTGVANFYPSPSLGTPSAFTDAHFWASTAIGTTYFLNDPLGTTQMELSSGGWPLSRLTFTPFGQEIVGAHTNTVIGPETPPDGASTHFKFTGKEREAESGLDFFGARYYASNMGRWMSPDWADGPEAVPYSSLGDPQSLNLYQYVGKNPLSRADADGHDWGDTHVVGSEIYGSGGADAFFNSPDHNRMAAGQEKLANIFAIAGVSPAAQQQVSFSTLAANYPGHDTYPTDPNAPNSIWSIIGGHVAMNAWTTDADGNQVPNNTCAIRMSYDLNQSGLTIPKGRGTVSGADGKQYFLRVADLQKFLTGALGQPQRLAGGSFAGPAGSMGVISFNIPFRDATGHFTLWNGSGVADPKEPYGSWPAPTSTLFWGIK